MINPTTGETLLWTSDTGISRARRRAVEWLADNSLIDRSAATRYIAEHPDPDIP